MSFRLKTFSLHLLASIPLLALSFGALYFGWYAWPGWYLTGAATVVGLIVLVDLVLGPLITLLIASPSKPRAELRRDISIIVLVQVIALSYGMMTLWQGRPLYYALTMDRIELITAADLDRESLEQAVQKGAKIIPTWTSRPEWIWVPLPNDPKLSEEIILSAINTGKDIISMPEHFKPWAAGADAFRRMLHPLPTLKAPRGLDEAAYKEILERLGQPESDLGWLMLQGPRRNGSMIFDRMSGRPLLFVKAEPKIPKPPGM